MKADALVAALYELSLMNSHMIPIAESWAEGVWTVDLAIHDESGLRVDATAEDESLARARQKALARLRRSYTLASRAKR